MASFWILSLLASLYLARVSVRPLLESMQKQQSFVENASHELRTPLAVLQNRLETLFRKPEATIMDVSEKYCIEFGRSPKYAVFDDKLVEFST